ncbi:MAG: bifunctional metallophosphatase/5'-nucleotidase [Candidatus Aureabacteria bacterium]|nr:bifunctional metallophosphatase/5'-nucleotidase [Candidatus Auribacterota bacterium]
MLKRFSRPLFLASLALLAGCAVTPRAPLRQLCILHTNDVHGHITEERVEGWRKPSGGAATLASCVREIREENRAAGIPTLLLDAGDIFLGTPEGTVSKGIAVVETMNAAGYDAMAIGNHEFDFGVGVVEALAAAARFPILGANVRVSSGGPPPSFLRPAVVKDADGLKVGIIGVITESTPAIVMPGRTEKLVFEKPQGVVREQIAALKAQGVDFIVLLSHCGSWQDKEIAAEVKGIGVIVGGHGHELLRKPLRVRRTGTLIVQAGGTGQYLGRLDCRVDPDRGRVASHRYELVPLEKGRCLPDPEAQAIVDRWAALVGERFDETVAESSDDFAGNDTAEAPLGNLIADSMRAATGAQIAFHNNFGIRNPLLAGPVTYRDIYKILPFDNTLYTMTLTGAQLLRILEQSLALKYGILQLSGLTVEYSPKAPEGSRVGSVRCGGEPLDPAAAYTVTTNSFLAQGGDSYATFLEGRDMTNSGVLDRDAFADYLRARSPVSAGEPVPSRLIPR